MSPLTENANKWARPAVQIAAAGLGAAVAGPIGGAIGGWLAGALGASAGKLVEKYAEKFGDSAADKILSLGEDSLLEKLKDPALHLDDLYRQTLRVSLKQLAAQNTDDEARSWYQNWEASLAAPLALALDAVPHEQYRHLDDVFCRTMIRMDAEGAAIRAGGKASITFTLTLRELPASLRTNLLSALPPLLGENFRTLIVKPEFEQAWKSSELAFQEAVDGKLNKIGDDAAATRRMVEELLRQSGDAEKKRLEEQIAGLRAQLLASLNAQQNKQTDTLISLLSIRDFSGAIHLKTEAVEERRAEQRKGTAKPEELARDLFELGMIYELQRGWPKARDVYREAWKLEPTFEHGFKYAYAARTLNDDATAIAVGEKIVGLSSSDADRAALLTNLGILCSRQGQDVNAENSYREAIEIYRSLQSSQPGKYLAELSGAYGDLAQLYAGAGTDPANIGELYRLALDPLLEAGKSDPLRWLPMIAEMYTAIGSYQSGIGRDADAELSFRKALGAYNEIQSRDGSVDVGKFAMTLSNFAWLETRTAPAQAAEHYGHAISIFRALAQANAAIYNPLLIRTLYGRAQWQASLGHADDAIADYRDALSLYPRDLGAMLTADAKDLADALDSLATLLAAQKDWKHAEAGFDQAVAVRTEIAHRDARGPDAAAVNSLLNRAKMRAALDRMPDAWTDCVEAGRWIEPLWQADPKTHGDLRARVLIFQAGVGSRLPEHKGHLCPLAQDALACASEAATRAKAQTIVAQLCGATAVPVANS